MVHWGPTQVKMEHYHSPAITFINCGAAHSALIDDIGRLFLFGRGESGQLGNASYHDSLTPLFVQTIPDKALDVACGEDHTIVTTRNSGEVYVMGSNLRG
jgi:alpha-tubulin suppressor-like RCC1 family protein